MYDAILQQHQPGAATQQKSPCGMLMHLSLTVHYCCSTSTYDMRSSLDLHPRVMAVAYEAT